MLFLELNLQHQMKQICEAYIELVIKNRPDNICEDENANNPE